MIYLDNAATTAPNKKALEKATQIYEEYFYNPSASYKQGAEVHAIIEDCKRTILETLVSPEAMDDYDIIFTGSGTEADNLALRCPHNTTNPILLSNREHDGVFSASSQHIRRCVDMDGVDYDCINRWIFNSPAELVSSEKLVDFCEHWDDKSPFVTYIHVSNETGEITDICGLARKVKERVENKTGHAVFHSDGVQAYGKIPFKLTPEIDMYSISAHKIGGIKGIGALIVRKNAIPRLHPVIYGGGQGNGLRSGTENVLGIIDFAEAVKEWGNPSGANKERFSFDSRLTINGAIAKMQRETLWELLDKERFTRISPEDGSPYILTVSAVGKNNEIIQQCLSERGILVGIGSACSSTHMWNKGRVLRAMGYGEDIIQGELRFSFSPDTKVEEVKEAARAVNEIVQAL